MHQQSQYAKQYTAAMCASHSGWSMTASETICATNSLRGMKYQQHLHTTGLTKHMLEAHAALAMIHCWAGAYSEKLQKHVDCLPVACGSA